MGNGELSKSFYPDSPPPVPTEDGTTNIASKRPSTASFTFLNSSNSITTTTPQHKPETIARWYYKCAACWVPRNLFKLEAEARRGSKLARCFLARMHVYDATFIKKDIPKAIMLMDGLLPWLQRESALVDSPYHLYAMFLLATCYAKGIGIEQNTSIAYQLYSESALQGYDAAQNALAKCYKQGLGIDLDLHQAIKWFEMAAEQGHAEAQYNLGYLYEHGWSPPTTVTGSVSQEEGPLLPHHATTSNASGYVFQPNQEKALYYYQLSGSQGNAHALYSLGWYLRHGSGGVGPKNFAESLRLFLIAAEKGLADAQYIVGLSYDVGDTSADEQNDHDMGQSTAITNTNNNPKEDSSTLVSADTNNVWQQRRLTAVEMTPTRPTTTDKKLLMTPKTAGPPMKGTILSFSPMPSEYEATMDTTSQTNHNNLDMIGNEDSGKSDNMLQASVFSPSEKRRYLAPESPANFQQIVIDLSPVPPSVLSDARHLSNADHTTTHAHTGHTSTTHHSSHHPPSDENGTVTFPFPPAETTTPLLYNTSSKHHHHLHHQNHQVAQTKDVLICVSPNPHYQHVHQPFRFRVNAHEAFKWYLLAAEQGHAGAQCNVGYAFMTGEGLPEHYYDNYCASAAEQSSSANAVVNTDLAIETLLLSILHPTLFAHSATSENGTALYRLWRETQAVQWYMASATQGHEEGQYNLALCHLHGDGALPRDLPQAMKLFRASATQGHHLQAQYELAKCHRYLAERQHRYKQTQLALLSRQNSNLHGTNNRLFSKKLSNLSVIEGVSLSGVDCATEVYQGCVSAADQGCVSAMFLVGECYEYGFGVKKSATEARRWYEQTLAYDTSSHVALASDTHTLSRSQQSRYNHHHSNHTVHKKEVENAEEDGNDDDHEDGNDDVEEGIMLALFRMGYACLPAVYHQNPYLLTNDQIINSINTSNSTNNTSTNNKNNNGLRMQMLLCSLPKAIQSLLKAAHGGHLLAQAFVAQQLEMEILKPLYPLSAYHSGSFTMNTSCLVSKTMGQQTLKSQVTTLWTYYENVAGSILQKLAHRLHQCYLFHKSGNVSNDAKEAGVDNEQNRYNETVHVQSPADTWAKISAMLFFDLFPTNHTNGGVDMSLLSVEFIRYLNKDVPINMDENAQENTSSFSSDNKGPVSEKHATDPTTAAFEETLLWWFADDAELLAWNQSLMAQASYFVARQCERYLLSSDNESTSNDHGTDREAATAEKILFEHVDAFFQTHSLSNPAQSKNPNDADNSRKAHQWSIVLMLYYFAAVYGNHRLAMARLAALLLTEAECWTMAEEDSHESVVLPWLGMLSMSVVPNRHIDSNHVHDSDKVVMDMVSALVQPTSHIHTDGNNKSGYDIDKGLTRWYIRDFLRWQGMRLWYILATEKVHSPSSNNTIIHQVPLQYTTKIAQYRLALAFETLANEYATVLTSLEEQQQQELHEMYLHYFIAPPSAIHSVTSLYQPFHFGSMAGKGKHVSPSQSPSRVSPNGSMFTRIPESPVSPNASFIFPAVGTHSSNSHSHYTHNLALLKRRCPHYQQVYQEQAILYFHEAAGGRYSPVVVDDRNDNGTIDKQHNGYYLAQYSLAWSCEQHLASSLYGVSESQQETYAKHWYEQVVLPRLPSLLHEVKRLHQIDDAAALTQHTIDNISSEEQQNTTDTINNYRVVHLSNNVNDINSISNNNNKANINSNMTAWQLENQGELWLWDVYPERFHFSTLAGVWQGRQDTVSDACFALAQGYQLAHGVDEKDIMQAMHWYVQAISVADVSWVCPVTAQSTLDVCSENGVGDIEMEEAGEEVVGHADALYQLGCIYLYGDSSAHVAIDYKTAKRLLQRSAQLGHEEAKSLLEMSSSSE